MPVISRLSADDMSWKRVRRRTTAFPAEEDEDDQDETQEEEEKAEAEDKVDLSTLTDDHLKAALLAHGVKTGPIVDTTRRFYERTLRRLQADEGQETSTIETIVLSSDSEDNQADCDGQEEEEECSKAVHVFSQNRGYDYPQSFSPSSRMRAVTCNSQQKVSKPASTFETKVLAGSMQSCTSPHKSFSITQMVEEMEGRRSKVNDCEIHRRWSSSDSVDMTAGVDERRQSQYFTPMGSLSERQEKELIPDMTTSTAISVACRRPIKGAAGRPVRYQRRPVSPRTEDRKEVECDLVPVQVQFVLFVFLAVLLFVVEDQSLSPFLVLVYNLVTSLCNTESNLQETVPLLGQD
ncbi:lamina-associated polypeptide 2, isoforms beta/gamma-like isoform X2 [Nerophis ophidion]|uniref:lamina-associated polypeptide 2, isoforms beta/gamma-like isoform X2 n=1 Tax=Nerophis ophidion TaxID=159077 RepID=UPI002ADEFF27|nr:lamina-associated polypeptide 2, isoforms beta/gamma-like isoform X2 [Nerophis ophidion]